MKSNPPILKPQHREALKSYDNTTDTFFATVKPPKHFADALNTVDAFLTLHLAGSYPVVLVTSGGTIVPLERQMVRFLDNFSAGSRGSISAEWFLRRGCAVIFLHRQFSLQPFARHYRHADELILDLFEPRHIAPVNELVVRKTYQSQILSDLDEYYKFRNHFTAIHFYTVADYLFLLQGITQRLAPFGRRAIIYLASAVSDFYLPENQLSNHKIQSDEGTLVLKLEPVPKVIKPMVINWCPQAFIISFKLETDPNLLLSKARQALTKYQHDLVIANLLSERKRRVTIVHRPSRNDDITKLSSWPDKVIECEPSENNEIEQDIVDYLLMLHSTDRFWD